MIPTPALVNRNRLVSAFWALAFGAFGTYVAWRFFPGMVRWVGMAAGLLAIPLLYALWTARWRRRVNLLEETIPPEWGRFFEERVAFYGRLNGEEKSRFLELVRIFLDEVKVTAVGFSPDEETRLLVAAGAVIPIFGFPYWEYDTLEEVLVRPDSFNATFREDSGEQLQASGMVADAGMFSGTMILSKPDLEKGFARHGDKDNVAIHEFVHLVDKATGSIDGVPAGLDAETLGPWCKLVGKELSVHARDIPGYGFTSEVEFLAVAAEYYFENPDAMREKHPELYALMEKAFRQDLSSRFRGLKKRWFRPISRRIRRNAPCPCGSGEKYKKCCGRPGLTRPH